jgi:hypothetical protein
MSTGISVVSSRLLDSNWHVATGYLDVKCPGGENGGLRRFDWACLDQSPNKTFLEPRIHHRYKHVPAVWFEQPDMIF